MIAYDTNGPQYPKEWDESEPEEARPEFEIGEEYSFAYFSGPVSYTGCLWTREPTRSRKSIKCIITLDGGRTFERTLRVRHDDHGEYLKIPSDILRKIKVRP